MTNNEHTARLREMAEAKQSQAAEWHEQSTSRSPWSGLTPQQCDEEALRCEQEAAAMLAGAEALEKLPLAQEQAAKVWGLACERDELKASRAKALEAVEVAKAALETAETYVAAFCRALKGKRSSQDLHQEAQADWSRIIAARARLEGE